MAGRSVFQMGIVDQALEEISNTPMAAPAMPAMPEARRARPQESPAAQGSTMEPSGDFERPTAPAPRAVAMPADMLPIFEAASAQHGVPINVLMALAEQESGYNPRAVGPTTQWGRARGMMQYLDSTARGLNINPMDPVQAVGGAARQLRERLDRGYSMMDAVREHFAGPDRRQWGAKTVRYGEEVMGRVRRLGGEIGNRYAPPAAPEPPALTEDEAPTRGGAAPAQAGTGNLATDSGRLLGMGANSAAANLRELVSRVPVIGQPVVDGLDRLDRALTGRTSDQILRGNEEALRAGLTPEMRAAMSQQWWNEEKGTFGTAWTDPRAYMAGVLQSAPETVISMIPAMRVARSIYGARIAAGVAPEVAARAAGRAAMLTGAVTEGAMGGASAAREVRDQVMALPRATLERSDAFRALLNGDTTPEAFDRARKTLAEDASTRAFVTAGVATGIFGGLGDRVLARIVTERVSGNVARRLASGAARGALAEGLFEELPQSAAGKVAQNAAVQTANPDQPIMQGVVNEALGGLAIGGVQGGGMGAGGAAMRRPSTAPPAAPAGPEGPAPSAPNAPSPAPSAPSDPEAPPQGAAVPAEAEAAPAPEPIAPVAPQGPLQRAVAQQTATDGEQGRRVTIRTADADDIAGVVERQTPDGVMIRSDDGESLLVPNEDVRTGAVQIVRDAPAAQAAPAQEPVPPPAFLPPEPSPQAAFLPPEPQRREEPALSPGDAGHLRAAFDVGENGTTAALRDGLWEAAQKGSVAHAGVRENLLVAAKTAREAGGLQNRRQFDAFLKDWNETRPNLRTEEGRASAMEVVRRHAASPQEFMARDREATRMAEEDTRQAGGLDLAAATEPQLRERLRYLARQAREGGWTKPLRQARAEVERAIEKRQQAPKIEAAEAAAEGDKDDRGGRQADRGDVGDGRLRGAGDAGTDGAGNAGGGAADAGGAGRSGGVAEAAAPAGAADVPAATVQPEPARALAPKERRLRNAAAALEAAGRTEQAADLTKAADAAASAPVTDADWWKGMTPDQRAAALEKANQPRSRRFSSWEGMNDETQAILSRERKGEGLMKDASASKGMGEAPTPDHIPYIGEDGQQTGWTTDKTTATPASRTQRAAEVEAETGRKKEAANQAALDRRNAWRKRVNDWLIGAKAGDELHAPNGDERYRVVEGSGKNKVFGRSKSLVPVSSDGTIPDHALPVASWNERDGFSANAEMTLGEDGTLPLEDPKARAAANLGKLMEQGEVVPAPAPVEPPKPAVPEGPRSFVDQLRSSASNSNPAAKGKDGVSYRLGKGKDGAYVMRESAEGERTYLRSAPGEPWTADDAVRAAEAAEAVSEPVVPEKPATPAVADNSIFTADAAERARALIRSKLSQLNTGIDPELMQAGITLAGYHIERGARTFAAYAKAMVGDLGDAVKPYLKSWYMGVKFDPRAGGFDGMDGAGAVEAADVDAALQEDKEDGSRDGAGNREEVPRGASRPGEPAQRGDAPADPRPVEAGQSGDDGEASGGRAVVEDGDGGAGGDVAPEGRADGGGDAADGRPGAGREGVPDAGGGKSVRGRADPGVAATAAGFTEQAMPADMADKRVWTRAAPFELSEKWANADEDGRQQAIAQDGPMSFLPRGPGSVRAESGSGTYRTMAQAIASFTIEAAPATPAEVIAAVPAQPAAAPGPGNYHVADPMANRAGGPVARFNRNRAAIEMLAALRETGRQATADEQAVLSGYTGWGSFGQELFQGTWNRSMPKPDWTERDAWLREHLGQQEWESAQRSITNAHYTDPQTVDAMWGMARRMGFAGGRVLEPSMGIGNFFMQMPRDLADRSRLNGIEMDQLTGSMAQHLFPDANVRLIPYQDSRTPDRFYDLVIGNWPFENTVVADRRYNSLSPFLHDYFFLKGLDQLRPGGLMIGVTSAGTMDKKSPRIRAAMAKKAELVASIRLPSGAFQDYAGTKVVTDIVILKRRAADLTAVPRDATWVNSEPKKLEGGEISLNSYYEENPGQILGVLGFGFGTTIGRAGMIVAPPNDLAGALAEAAARVPEGIYERDTRAAKQISYVSNHTADREGSLTIQGDGLFVVRGEQLAPAEQVVKWATKNPTETALRDGQLRSLIEMRRLYAALIDAERAGDGATERTALREAHAAFTGAYGSVGASFGLKYLDRLNDPFYPALAALETKGKPAAILSQSTMRGKAAIENPGITDAFILARNSSVSPTLEEVAGLARRAAAEVKAELIGSGAVFETASGDIIPSDIYLSGNVRQKLRQAEATVAEGLTNLQRNVDALREVQPQDVPYFQIETQLGATWVPPAVYAGYVAHMLNLPTTQGIDVTFTNGKWTVRLPDGATGRPEALTGYGTPAYRFDRLVNAAFSNQTVTIRVKDHEGKEYVDTKATEEANARVAKMRDDMSDWLWSDPDRRVELEAEYNEVRNAYATPRYDGSFLRMEGMALTVGRGPFDLREHQKNAIWRALVNRRSINAHEVGTGKTFTMGGIAVESRRYGIARKPLILAHNANSASVAAKIQQMYPAAKVLYIDNLSPDNIKVRLRQIANDDWDAVVVPHSLIDRFAMRRETLMEMASEDIAALEEEAYAAAKDDGETLKPEMLDDEDALKKLRSPTAKDLVKARNSIIATIEKQAQRASRDDAVAFEDLGVDMVLVDEVHEFKKPPISTRMRMKGLNTQSSNRSVAMQFLARYIRRNNNGGNVHTFTGTPVTNTLTEVFHQMRYVMEDEMKAAGVDAWDGWFGSFAKEVQDVELSAAGEYEPVVRLAGFINVPELRRMVGQYMDVVFADDMPEMKPRQTASGKTMAARDLTDDERAELMNGRTEGAMGRPYRRVINVTSDLTPEQKVIFAQLQGYARSWRAMSPKAKKDAMLEGRPESPIITEGMANRASFDVRMLDGETNAGKEGQSYDDEGSKSSNVVRNALRIYASHPLAGQVIFAEQGFSNRVTRSKGRDADGKKITASVPAFSTVRDIVARLVEGGIPRNQIAVVDGAVAKEERRLIAERMNEGTVRVVIGSTDTLGVGVNMQRNLRAMHHMDAPYMPGELIQRNGRGERQGNQWNTVEEYRYMTDRLDGRRWQILAIKQRFINAFLKANNDTRVIEGEAAADEENDILQSFSEAAGDPRVLIREKLRRNLDGLLRRERQHGMATSEARSKSRILRGRADVLENGITVARNEDVAGQVAALLEAQKDDFRMTVQGMAFTKRSEAEAAIAAYMSEGTRLGQARTLMGDYADFPVDVSWPASQRAPIFHMEIGSTEFTGNSLRSLEYDIRKFPIDLRGQERTLEETRSSLARMEEVSTTPFQRAADLDAARSRLEKLEEDIAVNPVPPPAWLRAGTPVDTAAFRNGREFSVTGHRWASDGWFVTAEDGRGVVLVPYMEVTDAQGVPVYEERPFEQPVVQAPPPGSGGGAAAPTQESVPAGWGEVEVDPTPAMTAPAFAALQATLRTIAGPDVVVQRGVTGHAEGIASGNLIRLALTMGEERAAWVGAHEAMHTLRNMGRITPREWAILTDAADREEWAARFGVDRRYANRPAEVQAEEAVVEAFAAWSTGNLNGSGLVTRIFQQIRGFLSRIRNAMAGRGFASAESIFGKALSGEMGRREVGSGGAGTRLGTETAEQMSARLDEEVAAGRFTQDGAGLVYLSVPTESAIKDRMRSWIDKAEPAMLATIPLRPLLEEVGGYLPSARTFLRTKQAMDAMRAKWFNTSAEVSNRWLKFRSGDRAANTAMMDLMHRSTLAELDPSSDTSTDAKGTVTNHAGNPDWQALRKDYLAMPEEAQALYGEVRDTYSSLADAFDAALMASVDKAVRKREHDARRVRDREVKRIDAGNMADDAKAAARDVAERTFNNVKNRVRLNRGARMYQLRTQFETKRIKGPYFPLARFGDFYVTARDAGGEVVSFSRFENSADQRRFAREMEKAGHTVTMDRVASDGHGLKSQVDASFVAEVEGILEGAAVPEGLMDEIWQRFLHRMPDLSIRTSRIHRKGTAGFTSDALRAFGHHMFHGSHQLARLNYATDLADHVDDARVEARDSGRVNTAQAVVNEMSNRLAFIMNPTGGQVAQRISTAGFIYHLSVSPAAALVNLTQTVINGVPMLAAYEGSWSKGPGKAMAQLSRAMKDITTGWGKMDRATSLTPEEQDFVKVMYEIGLADRTETHDLAGVGETGVRFNAGRERVVRALAFGFHHAERINREVTGLAAYRMARAKGLEHAEAIEKANSLTWKIHFDYQNTSRPRMMQNDTAKVLLMFRNFTVNMLYRLFRDVSVSVAGADPETRKEARMQLLGTTMMLTVNAGIKGTWGFGLGMMLAGAFMGFAEDAEDELKKWMQRNLGVTATAVLMDGVPGWATGTALSGRIGMGDLWFRSNDRDLEGKDQWWAMVGQFLGAGFGILDNIRRGAMMAADGNVVRGIETMMPKAIRDLMRAERFTREGARTAKGDAIIEEVTPTEVLRQALGFTPARIAQATEQNNTALNMQKAVNDRRSEIVRAYADALREDNQGAMDRAQARLEEFNLAWPEKAIRGSDVTSSFRTQQRNRARSQDGVVLDRRLDETIRGRLPQRAY